jgi:hypothetical protein
MFANTKPEKAPAIVCFETVLMLYPSNYRNAKPYEKYSVEEIGVRETSGLRMPL